MSLKKCFVALALTCSIVFTSISCKSKVSDADLKAKVENVISNSSGVAVDVKDGVVTLSGVVSSQSESQALESSAKAADSKNIKSVVNNIVVAAPQVEINTDDSNLAGKIIDATKDFPSVQTSVKDGIITVTGTVEQARVQVLKQSLDALNPKKVDMSALIVK